MKKSLALCVLFALVLVPVALAEDGAAIFKAKCAMCHGPNGDGQTTMGKNLKLRDLGSADVQKLSDADLIKITTDGKGKMPAYKGKLSDADIAAVVKHLRTFKK
ncbi:MAG: c-type cytochrome [Thermoanaerobaculia bacterium]